MSPLVAASIALAASPLEVEFRDVLDTLVAVDTSHGNETAALEPIASRYRDAGVPAQLLESAPGRGNLIVRLPGSGKKRPLLLLAHIDVVPIEGQAWTVPPFGVTEKDGFLWGRGVNDDKGMAAAIVAVTLDLARSHTRLARDVVVVLSAGEETGGAAGVGWLIANHPELLDAEIALNEGGSVRMTDDLATPLTVAVGVSEKTVQTYRLVAHGPGGHPASPPTSGDPVVALANALVRVGDVRFPGRVLPEVAIDLRAQLPTADARFVGALRHVLETAPEVAPEDDATLRANPAYNAALHTTCVTTMLQAANQDNVLPTTAEATVSCRILPGDTRASVLAALTRAVGNDTIEILPGPGVGDAASSSFDSDIVGAVTRAAKTVFPGAVVVPAMTPGATDARLLRSFGIRVYGVAPMTFSVAEGKAGHIAHGADERRPTALVGPTLRYFREVVLALVR